MAGLEKVFNRPGLRKKRIAMAGNRTVRFEPGSTPTRGTDRFKKKRQHKIKFIFYSVNKSDINLGSTTSRFFKSFSPSCYRITNFA